MTACRHPDFMIVTFNNRYQNISIDYMKLLLLNFKSKFEVYLRGVIQDSDLVLFFKANQFQLLLSPSPQFSLPSWHFIVLLKFLEMFFSLFLFHSWKKWIYESVEKTHNTNTFKRDRSSHYPFCSRYSWMFLVMIESQNNKEATTF